MSQEQDQPHSGGAHVGRNYVLNNGVEWPQTQAETDDGGDKHRNEGRQGMDRKSQEGQGSSQDIRCRCHYHTSLWTTALHHIRQPTTQKRTYQATTCQHAS